MRYFKIAKEKRRHIITIFGVEYLSNYVAQHAGQIFWSQPRPDFDSTFFTFLALSSCSKYAETTLFVGFQQNCFFAHPQRLGTLFVNTTALTEVFPFSAFLFSWVFAVSGFLSFSSKEWNPQRQQLNTIQPKKQDHKMQTRKPLSLVYKEKQSQTTQTQNNATSLFRVFRLQTDNTRNKK